MRPGRRTAAPAAARSISRQAARGCPAITRATPYAARMSAAALRVAGPAGAPDGGPELLERLVDVAEVAQHDARRLVGDGGDLGSDAVGEQGAGGGERLVRPGQGEGQQSVQVRRCRGALRGSRSQI